MQIIYFDSFVIWKFEKQNFVWFKIKDMNIQLVELGGHSDVVGGSAKHLDEAKFKSAITTKFKK